MKIALVGSAPSSVRKAPYGDSSWLIWGCSPALYPIAGRVDAWFELHRWEPPVIGKPDQQVPWFSPEYVMWMAQRQCPVWMVEPVPEIPQSTRLPHEELVRKYGHFFFNSSLSWMAAMAIEAILLNRELLAADDPLGIPSTEPDAMGFWGVDMAADEEQYTGQKSGCQFFATLAASLNIRIVTPPESDLMIPRPLYGISESSHRHVKLTTRMNELQGRKAQAQQALEAAKTNMAYIEGVLDDMKYHLNTWIHEGDISGPRFEDIFQPAARVAEALARPVPAPVVTTVSMERPASTPEVAAGTLISTRALEPSDVQMQALREGGGSTG